MKTIHLISIAAAAITLMGCEKDLPSSNSANGTETTVFTELAVPADFDWQMVSEVQCNITSEHPTKVALATDQNAEPFATFMVGEGYDPMTVSIPNALSTVSVRYQTADETWKSATIPAAKTITFAVPADCLNYAANSSRAGEVKSQIIYPNPATWGTLLFEDLWPGYGDYDLNDLALSYRVEQDLVDNKVVSMTVKIKVEAVSGALDFNVGMSLHSILSREIKSIDVVYNNKVSNKIATTWNTEAANNYAIIRMNGLRSNTADRPTGKYNYVNTEHGCELTSDKLAQFNYIITFTEPIEPMFLTMKELNFFINRIDAQDRHIEIHMGGFKPTYEANRDYETIRRNSINTNKQNKPYFSNSNLVWALNVPAAIAHAYEAESFLLAYPEFQGWVTSNGVANKEWYLNGVDDKLVRVRK